MISVCMATYNGEKYIKEQIDSILPQLGEGDELVISDDSSVDRTVEIVQSYKDKRIKLFTNQKFHSPIFNFEFALKQAKGDIIFLSDQDDVWLPNKVEEMSKCLSNYDLVVSDCSVVDKDLKLIRSSFMNWKSSHEGGRFIKHLYKNPYLGCCMAFRNRLLKSAIPFPSHIAMHDIWLGLMALIGFKVYFLNIPLIKYRRHGNNASPASEKSHYSLSYKISYRAYLIKCLLCRYFFN